MTSRSAMADIVHAVDEVFDCPMKLYVNVHNNGYTFFVSPWGMDENTSFSFHFDTEKDSYHIKCEYQDSYSKFTISPVKPISIAEIMDKFRELQYKVKSIFSSYGYSGFFSRISPYINELGFKFV